MRTFAEYLRDAEKYGSLGKAALHWQCKQENCSQEEIIRRMYERLKVMRDSAHAGLAPDLKSVSGMVGGQAARMIDAKQVDRFGLLGKAGAFRRQRLWRSADWRRNAETLQMKGEFSTCIL